MDDKELAAAAAVIEQARGSISVRKAAERAGLSEGRWRQIAKGYQSAAGMRIPVSTPPETLARMAVAVSVTEQDLRAAGADRVADALRLITSRTRGVGLTLNLDRYEAAAAAMRQWFDDEGSEDELHPPTVALWLWTPLQLSIALTEQVEVLEQAFSEVDRERYRLMLQGKSFPDATQPQESDEDVRPAPTKPAGSAPADPVQRVKFHGTPTSKPRAGGPPPPDVPPASDRLR